MMFLLSINGQSQRLLSTLMAGDEIKQFEINRLVDELPSLPIAKRIEQETVIINDGFCPGCGSSLKDSFNHLEGQALNYQCTYCNNNK